MTDVGAQQRSLLSKTCQDPANGEKQFNYATPKQVARLQILTKRIWPYNLLYLSIYIWPK